MTRTIGRRRGRRGAGGGGHGPLTLIPMIDMLTILVVYLLVHAADTEILSNTRNIAIPQSISELKPRETTLVTVTRDTLYVNGAAVLGVAALAGNEGAVVEELRAALAAQPAVRLAAAGAEREVTVLAERSLPYAVLRKIIASCSAAEYSKVSMAVVEREQALASVASI